MTTPGEGSGSKVYASIANLAIAWASTDRPCPGLPGRSAAASCAGSGVPGYRWVCTAVLPVVRVRLPA